MSEQEPTNEPSEIGVEPAVTPEPAPVGERAPKPTRATPERTCIVTRKVREPNELIRFVVSPADVVTPDLAHRLPGRGIWVTATADDVERAVKTKAFNRAAKRQVTVPDDLVGLIAHQLERRAVDALSLCNKAGAVMAGFDRVTATLAAGDAQLLLHATDAAEDGAAKLDRLYRAVARDAGREAQIRRFVSAAQMGLAIGRLHVVHVALKPGGATRHLVTELRRLDVFYGRSMLGDASAIVPPATDEPPAVRSSEAEPNRSKG